MSNNDFKSSSLLQPIVLCKHLLFILNAIEFQLQPGTTIIQPHHILRRLESQSLSTHYLTQPCARLCKSHHSSKCFSCDEFLHETILTCPYCAAPFHPRCVNNNNECPSCKTITSYLSSSLFQGYRNLSNVLHYCGYQLSFYPQLAKLPSSKTFTNETQKSYFNNSQWV